LLLQPAFKSESEARSARYLLQGLRIKRITLGIYVGIVEHLEAPSAIELIHIVVGEDQIAVHQIQELIIVEIKFL
jgi:hypothetical protein